MRELQKALVIGLGGLGDRVCSMAVKSIGTRELEDGRGYPEFLYNVFAIRDGKPSQRAEEEESPDESTQVEGGQDLYIPVFGDFKDIKAEFVENLERCLGKVSDASRIAALRREREFVVKREIIFYVVAPICDDYGQQNFLRVLQVIHEVSRKHHYFLIHGILLLPDLFSSLGKDYDPELYKARAYVTLEELDQAMSNREDGPWDDRYPLDKIWLVDGWNQTGFIPFEEMGSLLAEAITSMIVDGVLEKGIGPGVDEREIVDNEGKHKLYSSFGFSQLLFPKDELRRQLLSRIEQEFLAKYILRQQPMDSNSVVVDVRRFIHHELEMEDLKEEIQRDKEGKSIVPPFVSRTDKELPAKQFTQGVKRAAKLYERGQLEESKSDLLRRAEEVREDKLARILNRATNTINSKSVDGRMSGISYSWVFYDELLDQENPLSEGALFEEKENLLTVHQRYETAMEEELGMKGWREELKKVESRLEEKNQEMLILEEEIASLQRKVEGYELDAGGAEQAGEAQEDLAAAEKIVAEAELKRLQEDKDGVEGEIKRLEEEKQVLQDKIALIRKIWEDDEVRFGVFRKVDKENQSQVEQVEQALISTEDQLVETEQELQELLVGRFVRLRDLFLIYPAAAIVGWLIASIIFLAGRWLSIPQMLEAMFAARWGALAIVVGYLGWAGWRYYKEILKQISIRKRAVTRLRGELDSLKTSLIDAYQTFFTKHVNLRTYEMAINKVLKAIIREATEHRKAIKAFLDRCEARASELRSETFVYPESISRTSVISDKDSSFFFNLVVGDEIDKAFERFFTGAEEDKGLAMFVRDSEDGFKDLEKEIAAIGQRYLDKLTEISIEEIVFDHWQDLNDRIRPENRLDSLLTVTPFVEIQALPGDDKTQEIYSIGVEEVANSRLESLIQSTRVQPQLFSHHDKTKIIAFCRTTNFSMRYLSQLEFYREAYYNIKDDERGKELHSEGSV